MTIKNPTLKANRKPFSEFFKQVDVGHLEAEAADALSDLVHACTETGKAGSVTITIKLKPIGGKAGQVELDTEVKAKLPKPARGSTLMFATPDNNLQREDPRQQTLTGLRTPDQEAEVQTQALRAVDTDAAPTKLRSVSH